MQGLIVSSSKLHEVTPIIISRHGCQGGEQSYPRAPDLTTVQTSPKASPLSSW